METNAIEVTAAKFHVSIPADYSNAHADVFDISGKLLGHFVNQNSHFHWDGILENRKLKAGLYLIQLRVNNNIRTEKVFIEESLIR